MYDGVVNFCTKVVIAHQLYKHIVRLTFFFFYVVHLWVQQDNGSKGFVI